jgi:hypothetical protein
MEIVHEARTHDSDGCASTVAMQEMHLSSCDDDRYFYTYTLSPGHLFCEQPMSNLL